MGVDHTTPGRVRARDRASGPGAGAILRQVRVARGLTQAELGALCGYSASQISRLESGRQPLTDVDVLRRFAGVLGIPPHLFGLAPDRYATGSPHYFELGGQGFMVGAEVSQGGGESSVRRRDLLIGMSGAVALSAIPWQPASAAGPSEPADLLVSRLAELLLRDRMPTADPVPLARLQAALSAVKDDFQACRYSSLAAQLPRLVIAAASTADHVDGDDRLAVQEALAETYNVVAHACVKFDAGGIDWISAERAMAAARASGSVLAEAESTRTLSMLARRAGHHTQALTRAVTFADRLHVEGATPAPEALSVRGILLTNAGYTAAKAGDRTTARDLFAEAGAIARQLGRDRNDRWTAFGPTNVTLFQISAASALGDFGTAIDLAASVPTGSIRLPERQARYWVDVARAYCRWDKPAECYRALLTAERLAPEEVRARPVVRGLVRSLLSSPGQRSMPELRELAGRVRVEP
ncbi:helix-turn-helix domain-containing protein [Planosporangium mesophilum]|uniref:HTH cro/C1-type domain-containing protein n=1 Tax=Planosporangium mesophilum TaxID=689768 RepID=A0A8J3X3C4_9ACTN|nr:helix-turn-helix transcriptional regulator [Planosporangium mesophilum]NJC83921.1 helix-turn-helix domain-containing protein [Planosporangium mesophilum]GII22713.1 hypothetical protein Pme01_23100 [Planosporangium mesophilum]